MIKKCPKCKSEQIITDAGCCSVCGANVNAAGQEEGDQLDLIVREVPEDDREFVGGSKTMSPGDLPEKGETRPHFKDKKTGSNEESQEQHRTLSYDPIGFSEPTLPPEPDNSPESGKIQFHKPGDKHQSSVEKSTASSGKFKKLTPEEVKAIEKNLYGKNVRLGDKEKSSIRSKINEIENQSVSYGYHQPNAEKHPLLSETLKPADSDTTGSGRGRGVAYFYKNFIKLPDQHHLTKHDELTLNGKVYGLQPKKLKPTYVYAAAAVAFALVLLLIASWFVKDASDGKGQVAGIVLDGKNQPYLKGASIRFPDLGKTIQTNAQGLFSSDDIPAGAHRIEYLVDGRVVGSDHATVLENGISMLALKPSTTKAEQKKLTSLSSKPASPKTTSASIRPSNQEIPEKNENSPSPVAEGGDKKLAKPEQTTLSAIVLASNVDGAKFTLNGTVMGAGNLKYSPVKPGTYKYEVDAAGYKVKTGTVTVAIGETKTLELELEPLSESKKETSYAAEDYFQSGVNALKAEKYENAISDFTKALEQNPSYPQAVYNRGLAYQQQRKNAEAHEDFLKAAEQYRMKKEYSWAVTSFNRALEINNKSIAALLGRGDLYLAKGEEIAALADFDVVLKLDKRNYQAYMGMGKARFQQANFKLAVENFKNARAINKEDPYLYQYLMLSYVSLSDIKEVKKAYERFQEIATDSQRTAMAKDKRFTAAIQIAKR